MKKLMIGMLALGMTAMAVPAEAKKIPELESFLRTEIQSAADAVEKSDEKVVAGETGWYLRRFLFRVKAPVGIDVPFLAKFKIVPEVEMLWQRDYPEGWSGYKP